MIEMYGASIMQYRLGPMQIPQTVAMSLTRANALIQ